MRENDDAARMPHLLDDVGGPAARMPDSAMHALHSPARRSVHLPNSILTWCEARVECAAHGEKKRVRANMGPNSLCEKVKFGGVGLAMSRVPSQLALGAPAVLRTADAVPRDSTGLR